MCVCEFMPALGMIQSNVSFHLKTLKQAGLIVSRREGRWMLYSLNRRAFERFCAEFSSLFGLVKWPEKTGAAAGKEAERRRKLACQQQCSSEPHQALNGGNDNANQ